MKASSATSGKATATARPTGPSSDRPRPTPTSASEFGLTGPSTLPDPATNAYRKDLADIALAGEVLASHYAEPVTRTVFGDTALKAGPAEASDALRTLAAGEAFAVLEDSLGWAWGYAARDHCVGYVPSDALSAS